MFTIGKLADIAKVTQRTIRYYEELELMQPLDRGNNRFRYYDDSHVGRLAVIKVLKEKGLGLKDISIAVSPILDLRGEPIPAGKEMAHKICEVLKPVRELNKDNPSDSSRYLLEGIDSIFEDIKPCLNCTEEASEADCENCHKASPDLKSWAFRVAKPSAALS